MATETRKLNIRSEYGKLRSVIMHRPDSEIDRLTPDNKSTLLFEDIPFLDKMQMEHDAFVNLLRSEGIEVLLVHNLLVDILNDSEIRQRLVTMACNSNQQASLAASLMAHYSVTELSRLLIGGLTASELEDKSGLKLGTTKKEDDIFLLDPIPNSYFTRDPAAVIGSNLISCKMHFPARIRETLILREIFSHHPLFVGNKCAYGQELIEDRPFTIEGGDIIVLSDKAIAVGCSQRTRSESISKLAKNLFLKGIVQRVYQINIPAERAYMHLDTVFTVVDEGIVIAYPNVMKDVIEVIRYEPMTIANTIHAFPIVENRNFNSILRDEFGHLKVIHTGNNNHRYASREQLADGTNVFAIAPSKVITYDRNIHTNNALKSLGVDVQTIEGSELVRGLGGPRCMTLPIIRD